MNIMSSPLRGIRRKKSSLSEIKVVMVGAPGVGKSALTVRFLTKRYIGEYDHQGDNKYRHEVIVDGETILFEIMDTCPKTDHDYPSNDAYQWADAIVLVFAITDRESFNYVKQLKKTVGNCNVPVVLIGNKTDMNHLRQVATEEGEILAKDLECSFTEVTAAEQVTQVADVFNELCRLVQNVRRKNKQSLLDRMLFNKPSSPARTYARGKSDSALPRE